MAATVFISMALASSAVPWSAAKAVAESARTAADAAATMKLRIMDFLPVRTCAAGSVRTCKMPAAFLVSFAVVPAKSEQNSSR